MSFNEPIQAVRPGAARDVGPTTGHTSMPSSSPIYSRNNPLTAERATETYKGVTTRHSTESNGLGEFARGIRNFFDSSHGQTVGLGRFSEEATGFLQGNYKTNEQGEISPVVRREIALA